MNPNQQPLVSILTPVYNGAEFLVECIESVLSQTYQNYEYIIVNNCSKDRTLEIALQYAAKDKRIRVHDNETFVDVIANHNIAFNLSSPNAKYIKIVSGDDFIFPDCVSQLVATAEANPSAGFIGCYQVSQDRVRWQGFEYPRTLFSGREICREVILGLDRAFGFGSPTSLLYRADIVKRDRNFYPNPSPHSDTSACFKYLRECNYAFVYQVLSFERIHQQTQSSTSKQMNRYSSSDLNDLTQYGSFYLTPAELKLKIDEVLGRYYRFLAVNYLIGFRDKEFWKYHEARLKELGYPLNVFVLLKAAVRAVVGEVFHPWEAGRRLLERLAASSHAARARSASSVPRRT